MELAVITDEIDADLGHALDVMAEYGVRGAELRQVWDKNIADAPREYWQRAKDLLDATGMHVVGIASPFYKCDLPGEESTARPGRCTARRRAAWATRSPCWNTASRPPAFSTPILIRVFSFWKHGPLTPEIEETDRGRLRRTRRPGRARGRDAGPGERARLLPRHGGADGARAGRDQFARRARHLGPRQRVHGRRSAVPDAATRPSRTSSPTSTSRTPPSCRASVQPGMDGRRRRPDRLRRPDRRAARRRLRRLSVPGNALRAAAARKPPPAPAWKPCRRCWRSDGM